MARLAMTLCLRLLLQANQAMNTCPKQDVLDQAMVYMMTRVPRAGYANTIHSL